LFYLILSTRYEDNGSIFDRRHTFTLFVDGKMSDDRYIETIGLEE